MERNWNAALTKGQKYNIWVADNTDAYTARYKGLKNGILTFKTRDDDMKWLYIPEEQVTMIGIHADDEEENEEDEE